MRAKLVTFGITAVAILALALQASPQAIAQGNANKSAAKKKAPPPPPPKPAQAKPAPAAADTGTTMAKPKPKPKPKRKAKQAMKGVPSGVSNCLKHLSQMASKDPLLPYEGHPEEIVNNGLLWNDPKSKCSVGSDENMRKKVADLAKAWRMKDAATVRSTLQELEGMAPK
jgi:type IV secretory pathway VirB10-like protein